MYTSIKKEYRKLIDRHENFWNKETAKSFGWAILLFAFAVILEHFADNYVGQIKGVAAGDILLDHIPTFHVDFFIVQGALLLTLFEIGLLLIKPKFAIFAVKALSMFVIVRSISISLTHLGANPNQLVFDPNSFGYGLYNILFNAKNDFFFSGHTGVPFLMSLIFWHEKYLRIAFLIISATFATSVLLAHVHYSVDVFASPFITYSIFAMSKYMFAKDYDYITKSNEP